MALGNSVFWLKEIDRENDLEFIILGYRGNGSKKHDLEAWIAPCAGSNLCRFSINEHHIIDFDAHLLKNDFTGTPILYPTPNRVQDGVFHYQGKIYPQVVNGATVLEHGLVHSVPWNYQEPQVNGDSITLKTWLDFKESSAFFPAFPFLHRLNLEFCLSEKSIIVKYTIENQDTQTIPYGFGLHPYFMKLSGDEETFVELPARYVMKTTSDLLPTGQLIDVAGTTYDLRARKNIGSVDLDHVFTGIEDGKFAQVTYQSLGLRVQLVTTSDFSHLVLYSPCGASFFCLENQTCSTNAHNLHDQNFKSESGLKFVQAGKIHTGSVAYVIDKEGFYEN